MKDRRKDIQDRINKRRKMSEKRLSGSWTQIDNEGHYGFETTAYEGTSEKEHPLFKKEYFYFKALASLCLFLLIAVIFKHPSAKLDDTRSFVNETMNQEFQFATVSNWYEDKFGKPIAFLPEDTSSTTENEGLTNQYALPASGKIAESFESNGEGVIMETDADSRVKVMTEGVVIFAGSKDDLGKTVVIQHSDKSESWYGHLGSIDVKLYENVKKGKEIGEVTASDDGTKGTFYLAIKKDDKFIDPKKVIPFE
ncbi:M23 family metallopeptidase [Peribacillus cavernae]|uniref:M23 family metallopeptidase n=1 Tax=Peribacillus cavernae TaxID=1674310 RepID=A0A433HH78_9BACI|nr:M23 family metallopeptidase [Peribacillus cavernae]MDQ0219367.1 stage IV sporulation protein FA [Peribacillus cavernae]RUQ27756.1 M23 family metallopeptidase [Peribacillus cavernae]